MVDKALAINGCLVDSRNNERRRNANALRALAMDAVELARSGHPGAPMGMADMAEVVWRDFLKHNPGNPAWPDRDRFVLSNGHASMLLYALLHLSGYALPIDELRRFRQLNSMTPGHPEVGLTPGVETSTGPLGQGFANAVGMALAETMLAARFNRPGMEIVNHYTYVFLGDGCLMEGVSYESASLAGVWKLGKLIALYDDNGISIDGPVDSWFSEDVPGRFRSCGWHVVESVDGHDAQAVNDAVREARAVTDRPSLICCRTVIGFGAPGMQGSEKVHGAPLGHEEVARAREQLGWNSAPFELPQEIYSAWDARIRGAEAEQVWLSLWYDYQNSYPQLAGELSRRWHGRNPDESDQIFARCLENPDFQKSVATRQASQMVLEYITPYFPELVGGSADLAQSNLTVTQHSSAISADDMSGNYIHFGVREFGMTAIANGLSLHGGLRPFVATFLVFSDYARNAIRMAALMGQPVIAVFSHDSVALGEDGPTHQPVEQLASLRLIPNLEVWRPCDTIETIVAWRCALEHTAGPSVLALTRQRTPTQSRTGEDGFRNIALGGYVLREAGAELSVVIIATGSEVALAMDVAERLEPLGIGVRVISMPCVERFDAQEEDYRHQVLSAGSGVLQVVIEAGITSMWRGYVSEHALLIGIDRFGVSAPGKEALEYFGLTSAHVLERICERLNRPLPL